MRWQGQEVPRACYVLLMPGHQPITPVAPWVGHLESKWAVGRYQSRHQRCGTLGRYPENSEEYGKQWGPRGKGRAWDPVSSQAGALL